MWINVWWISIKTLFWPSLRLVNFWARFLLALKNSLRSFKKYWWRKVVHEAYFRSFWPWSPYYNGFQKRILYSVHNWVNLYRKTYLNELPKQLLLKAAKQASSGPRFLIWVILPHLVLCHYLLNHLLWNHCRNYLVLQSIQFLLLVVNIFRIQCIYMP